MSKKAITSRKKIFPEIMSSMFRRSQANKSFEKRAE